MLLATEKQLFQVLGGVFERVCAGIRATTGKPFEMIYPGVAHPTLDSVEEWAAFNILASDQIITRAIDQRRRFTVEIIAYTMHSQYRKDKSFLRNRELADAFFPVFSGKRFDVAGTCVQMKEGKMMYLDLASLGDFAEGVRQRSPRANVNSIDMLFEGEIFESKLPPQ